MSATGSTARDTISWGEFALAQPDLARFGADKLTAAPAYLATVRRSGAPRVHPVTPILIATGLFLFMEPSSPKGRDLRERERFALHNGVLDDAGTGGEFHIAGKGVAVDGTDIWTEVARAASYSLTKHYVLFELRLSEARCLGYGDVELPETRRWSIAP